MADLGVLYNECNGGLVATPGPVNVKVKATPTTKIYRTMENTTGKHVREREYNSEDDKRDNREGTGEGNTEDSREDGKREGRRQGEDDRETLTGLSPLFSPSTLQHALWPLVSKQSSQWIERVL
jgi:hypothetical protein